VRGDGHVRRGARGAGRRTRRWRDDERERRRDEERLDAHVDQARDGGDGVIGVQRRQHQVAGERGLQGQLGGLGVADLADQDDVGVLAQDAAQPAGEGETDFSCTWTCVMPGTCTSTGSSSVTMLRSGVLTCWMPA
jgi:hypothetical protein